MPWAGWTMARSGRLQPGTSTISGRAQQRMLRGGQTSKASMDVSGDSGVQVSLGTAQGLSLLHAPPQGQGHHGGMA